MAPGPPFLDFGNKYVGAASSACVLGDPCLIWMLRVVVVAEALAVVEIYFGIGICVWGGGGNQLAWRY